jgi:hypothetical protein
MEKKHQYNGLQDFRPRSTVLVSRWNEIVDLAISDYRRKNPCHFLPLLELSITLVALVI